VAQQLKEFTPKDGTKLTKARVSIRTAKALIDGARRENKCNKTKLQNAVMEANAAASDARAYASAIAENVALANENIKNMKVYLDTAVEFTSKPIDPPIASIGQSVQFILAYGGNVTPTWSFVRFKGPNNPLFSTTGTRTHSLNITLGPINPTTNAPNTDVKQNQFYLQLNNLLTPLTTSGGLILP
jgi:hypothetical protein